MERRGTTRGGMDTSMATRHFRWRALLLASLVVGLPSLLPPPAVATMVGPVPLPLFGERRYVGVLREGETDHVLCTLTDCPAVPLCDLSVAHMRAELTAATTGNQSLVLRFGNASARLTGAFESVSLDGTDDPLCPDISVFAESVGHAAFYELRVRTLG